MELAARTAAWAKSGLSKIPYIAFDTSGCNVKFPAGFIGVSGNSVEIVMTVDRLVGAYIFGYDAGNWAQFRPDGRVNIRNTYTQKSYGIGEIHRYIHTAGSDVFVIDDDETIVALGAWLVRTTSTLFIGGYGASQSFLVGKVFSVINKDPNGNILRDYRPYKDDEAVGFKDTVTGDIVTNGLDGTLVYGELSQLGGGITANA